MSVKSMASSAFYNRKSSGRLLKSIKLQPHISIGFRGGINLYNYTEDNPINKTDPNGTFSISIDVGTVVIVVAIVSAAKFCYDLYKCIRAASIATDKAREISKKYYLRSDRWKEFSRTKEWQEVQDRCPDVVVQWYTGI